MGNLPHIDEVGHQLAEVYVAGTQGAYYVVIAVQGKDEPMRRFRISRGMAETLLAELTGTLNQRKAA